MTVWKFAIPVSDEFQIALPEGAQVLSVMVQFDAPQIWVLVDPKAPPILRHFVLRGTGHPIEKVGRFVGSFQIAGGSLVFHLFEAA